MIGDWVWKCGIDNLFFFFFFNKHGGEVRKGLIEN